ncbi:MAG: methyltransferase domain-containing protein [Ignavibacteria bacterium]|nr:methyltransferase domain-containing protein [Ignavibacteria bacterium]
MTVKEHYDNHLGNFYSWMLGDFDTNEERMREFFAAHGIASQTNQTALDLGCGNGIQSVALAKLGYKVKAVDFNEQLLNELSGHKSYFDIEVINSEFINYLNSVNKKFSLITSMGDTILHLESREWVKEFIKLCYENLEQGGKLILSFRDYTNELKGDARFIPVKSDDTRVMTCFLQYSDEYINVTDLLYEKINGEWMQFVSSYKKVRVLPEEIEKYLKDAGFEIESNENINRMIYLIANKI